MNASEYANVYGFLAWLIPSLISAVTFVSYCFWISRDRQQHPRRRTGKGGR